MTITPDRLDALDGIHLDRGAHNDFDQGHCAMEVVSWLAGQGFTDAPECASRVLRDYVITLNDRWGDEKRQQLVPFLPRMVGTGDDGKDDLRREVAQRFLTERLLEPWLRLAGMDAQADELPAMATMTRIDLRARLYAIRDEAWTVRSAAYDRLRVKVRAELEKRGVPAAAVAAAVAAAAAAAVAVAVAAADAVAVAVAAADAAADAAAAAAAAAAADAAADAAAAAAAATAAQKKGADPWAVKSAAYDAARAYYRDNPLPVMDKIRAVAADQEPAALELLELLIDPTPVSA